MLYTPNQDSLVGSSKMVMNVKLAKRVEDQDELYQKENRELKEKLVELANKIEQIGSVFEKKEMKEEQEEEVLGDDEDGLPKK